MNRIKWLLVPGLLVAGGMHASFAAADWGCRFKADRAGGVDAVGVTKVVIRAGAGDLEVRGVANAKRVEARGYACASSEQLLTAVQISVRREGDVIYVETDLPQYDAARHSMDDNDSAYLDLGIAVPNNLPVDGIDSSGDAKLLNLAALEFQDSSGDLRVTDIAGAVELQDSSGDLTVEDAGSVVVGDSSGNVRIRRVRGDATVTVDSSGDIRITDVDGSVVVAADSSGDIEVENVGGDFRVESDGSGAIVERNVRGKVMLPD
jgi:hypothetical protein